MANPLVKRSDSLIDQTPHLCVLCSSISISEMRGPDRDRMQVHQPNCLALKKSAEVGCQLCRFMVTALEKGTDGKKSSVYRAAMAEVSEKYPGRELSLVAWGDSSGNLDRVHIITTGEVPEAEEEDYDDENDGWADPSMHPDHQVAFGGVLDVYARPDDPAAWHGGVTGRPLPRSNGSEDTDLEQIRIWLQRCLQDHVSCPKASQNTPLPTRVIDIGPSGGGSEPHLVESCGRKGAYIALSHCWGGKVPLTTTTITLAKRLQAIPISTLPKTFREAAYMTRKLGVRYLWVDSLCILQDSREDWEKESAVMGEIYASSFVTIAARGSVNAAGGLFIAREEEPLSCRLDYKCADSGTFGSMFVRSPAFVHERLRDTPLDTRGWVLQERLLSPRVLYFGCQQLYWECIESTYRQDGMSPDIPLDGLRTGTGFKQDLDFNGALNFVTNTIVLQYNEGERRRFEKHATFLRWYNVVEEYSRRSLTYQSDKLPALTGIARAFQRKTGHTYLVGLWKEDLLAGLLWIVHGSEGAELANPSLPSWTWARWKGRVGFWSQGNGLPLRVPDGSCEVRDVSYSLAGSLNPFGSIDNAVVHLRGRLLQTRYAPPSTPAFDGTSPVTVFSMDGGRIGSMLFDVAIDLDGENLSFFCLLIHGGKNYPIGLALQPTQTPNNDSNGFKRIGCVAIKSDGESDDEGRMCFKAAQATIVSII